MPTLKVDQKLETRLQGLPSIQRQKGLVLVLHEITQTLNHVFLKVALNKESKHMTRRQSSCSLQCLYQVLLIFFLLTFFLKLKILFFKSYIFIPILYHKLFISRNFFSGDYFIFKDSINHHIEDITTFCVPFFCL